MAETNENDTSKPLGRRLVRRLIGAPTILAFVWPVLLVAGGYIAWDRWGSEHVAAKFYGLDLKKVTVNEPPYYVRTGVVETVYNDTALDQLSLIDPQSTAKIASAFATHPWVHNVVSVRKLPGGEVDIHLNYRKPVAMVHVFKPNSKDSGSFFFPVDGEGVLLPTTEFAQSETLKYIHIEVPDVYPTGVVGGLFGDTRVESAAHLAGILSEYRDQTGVKSIGVHGDPRQNEVPQLELTTSENRRLFWGSPPGLELRGEPTAVMKLKALLSGVEVPNSDLRLARVPSNDLQ